MKIHPQVINVGWRSKSSPLNIKNMELITASFSLQDKRSNIKGDNEFEKIFVNLFFTREII